MEGFKMKLCLFLCTIIGIALPAVSFAQKRLDAGERIAVAIVKNPYSGSRSHPEYYIGPEIVGSGGLRKMLEDLGCEIKDMSTVALTAEENNEYGQWHRLGLANNHLGNIVAEYEKMEYFTIGLLANCNSLMGMLAGLQHSGPGQKPLEVGLVWFDAHGDFNTPETTLSGMLGGMPVAVSAGLCLRRLRLKSGLDPAIPTKQIVMAGVRDLDPLEKELIDKSDIEMITVDEIKRRPENIRRQMDRLSNLVDIIYVHIDIDVLDPVEIPGAMIVDGGPSSANLAEALKIIFSYKKAAALGVTSFRLFEEGNYYKDHIAVKATYTLINGAIQGIRLR